jgi:hypothetical protein
LPLVRQRVANLAALRETKMSGSAKKKPPALVAQEVIFAKSETASAAQKRIIQ